MSAQRRGARALTVAAAAVLLLAGVALIGWMRPGGDASPAPAAGSGRAAPSASAAADAGSASASAPPSVPASPSRSASGSAAAGPAPAVPVTGHRQVTFVNALDQTIWVASGEQTPTPALGTTGWVLAPGKFTTITVPDHWNGRFWGRTGCSFDAAGRGHCETGDCAGRFQCRQYGAMPATLAEFNFNAWQNLDFYDVSLVDGSNLPMYINIAAGSTKDPISAKGCSAAGCTTAVRCPAELRVSAGSRVVGCASPCLRFDTDQYCCRNQWAPRDKCLPEQWPVNYAKLFKEAEPFAYSYVDDDATSTFTCAGECGYRITFGLTH